MKLTVNSEQLTELGIRNEELGIKEKIHHFSLITPHSSLLIPHFSLSLFTVTCSLLILLASCSFDYGNQEGVDKSQPDVVMNKVEYVRVRSAELQARFMAEQARRFEDRRLMELQDFTFEQFERQTGDVNAYGRAGSAEVKTDSGDIQMDDGVVIEVESEDIIIQTKQLEWKDKERVLMGGRDQTVNILRANGTSFSGIGFSADARNRTWEFFGIVEGTYIHDDEEETVEEAETISENLTDNMTENITEDVTGE